MAGGETDGEAVAGRHYVLWWGSGNFRCIMSGCALKTRAYPTPQSLEEHLMRVHRLEMKKAPAAEVMAKRKAVKPAWQLGDLPVDKDSLVTALNQFKAASQVWRERVEALDVMQMDNQAVKAVLLQMHVAAREHMHSVYLASGNKLFLWAEEKHKAMLEAAEEKIRKAQAAHDEDTMCKVCMIQPRNAVVLPCKHGSYCSKCLGNILRDRGRCPSCRRDISEILTYIT